MGSPTDGRAWTTICQFPQSYGYGTVGGSSWVSSAERLRSTYRVGAGPNQRYVYDGFFLARDPEHCDTPCPAHTLPSGLTFTF